MANVLDLVNMVLCGDEVEAELPKVPLHLITNHMEKLGYSREYESNGYQVDFWVYFEKDGAKYSLSGDLWYQNTYTFCKEGV